MLLYWILLPIVWALMHIIWRIEIIGRENLTAVRDGRAWVVAANHISDLDPVFIAAMIMDWKRMRILAKEELFHNPLIGWFLRCMGAVSIDRGKGDTTTLNRVTEECKHGTGVLIFPEGTRTKTGRLGNLKSGAFVIAAAAGADLVPCRIIYNTPTGRMRPFCGVRICFGPAIPAAELQITDSTRKIAALRGMKKRLQAELEDLLEQHRYPAPAFDARLCAAPQPQKPAPKPKPAPEPALPAESATEAAAPAATDTAATNAAPAVDPAAPDLPEPTLTLPGIEAPDLTLDATPSPAAQPAPANTPQQGE